MRTGAVAILLTAASAFLGACLFGGFDGLSGASDADAGADDAHRSTDPAATTDSGPPSDQGYCETADAGAGGACFDFDDGKLPLGAQKDETSGGTVTFGPGKDGTGGMVSTVPSGATNGTSAKGWTVVVDNVLFRETP